MNATVKKVGYTKETANRKLLEILNAVETNAKVKTAEAELGRIKREVCGTLQELHDLYDTAVKNIAAVKVQLVNEKLEPIKNKCGPNLKGMLTRCKNDWLENPYGGGFDGRNGFEARYVNPFLIQNN